MDGAASSSDGNAAQAPKKRGPVLGGQEKAWVQQQLTDNVEDDKIIRAWQRKFPTWAQVADSDLRSRLQTQRGAMKKAEREARLGPEKIRVAVNLRREREEALDASLNELTATTDGAAARSQEALRNAASIKTVGMDDSEAKQHISTLKQSYRDLSSLSTLNPVPFVIRPLLPKVAAEITRLASLIGVTEIINDANVFLRGGSESAMRAVQRPTSLQATAVPVGRGARSYRTPEGGKEKRHNSPDKIARPRLALTKGLFSTAKQLNKLSALVLHEDLQRAVSSDTPMECEPLSATVRQAKETELLEVESKIAERCDELVPLLRLRSSLTAELFPNRLVRAHNDKDRKEYTTPSMALIARPFSPAHRVASPAAPECPAEIERLFNAMYRGYLVPIPRLADVPGDDGEEEQEEEKKEEASEPEV